MENRNQWLRRIPSVGALLLDPVLKDLVVQYGKPIVLAHLSMLLNEIRKGILSSVSPPLKSQEEAMEKILSELNIRLKHSSRFQLQRVINATGVIIHTNLGRSPLSAAAVSAVEAVMQGYSNLEYSLEEGARGHRDQNLAPEICRVLGCEDATIVNNAAAGLFLTLNELASGRETVVSRGELVEIGGSFRIPEIMKASGTLLREVGTTNKTRLADYAAATHGNTALLLKVHASNFRLLGFTESVPIRELATLARAHDIPLVEDTGSGFLAPGESAPAGEEPCPRESLSQGCDLVIFSGDKLLGGPQAGILAGKAKWIQRLRRNPLMRILRPDKMTLAALEATFRIYGTDPLGTGIPVLQMIRAAPSDLKRRAHNLRKRILRKGPEEWTVEVTAMDSLIGGGSFPGQNLPSWGLRFGSVSCSVATLEEKLRRNDPPIIARIEEGRVLMDMRTIRAEEEREIVSFFTGR